MNNFFFKYLTCLLSGSFLITHSLTGEENMSMSSQKNMMMPQMMTQEMTENDLLNQMNDADKAVYQKLNTEEKALVLKMTNTAKMNNNPMMMMQKCMMMMSEMMSKMENMRDKKDMMEMKYSSR